MQYQQLGQTGLFVSRLTLGTMTFGGAGTIFGAIGGLDQKEADALVGRALDAGINFIDTANVYASGESEIMTGKALGSRRHEVVLATKVHGRMGPGANEIGLSRYHIMAAAEASLKRLGTDHIDLYQIHGVDRFTPIEETLRALDDLVHQGKVRYIGCSNQAAWHMMKALGISAAQNLEGDGVQADFFGDGHYAAPIVTIISPLGATCISSPGKSTVVEAYSWMTAGPLMRAPGPRRSRS